ncbi:MAG: alanine--tRNA ligase [Deltaproteobacteria bacterium]|nr:alanine--tRNA ligase [Deltaproteobacteria bacterium]
MTGNEIREKFLKYFEGKGHVRAASSSLIPANDPTLFFTNAGMVPFKDIFTCRQQSKFKRATTSQKCLRVSGKHNDLENVGRTPRHHTFFEMLGNFSFGDYFKKEAIDFAWDFLTNVCGIKKDFLWVTVFREDDDAAKLWEKMVDPQRIIRMGEEDNFWSMGETGPCGPCSEIHVDLKKAYGEGASQGSPATHHDDFMEIWNLVFMQFNRDEKGKMTPLPKPSIDTGMGLERLAAVLQGKKSNYDTDLFQPLIRAVSAITKKSIGTDPQTDVSLRVLADHIRATSFLISDGVLPSNEGRGYVLRRIMRRAIRHGKMLGMTKPFFYQIADTLTDEMGEAYPELKKNHDFIARVIKTEEERFLETLENGLQLINAEIAALEKSKKKGLSGEVAFKLYDTFGFPADLTQLIADEKGLSVDMAAFDREMEKQKERARSSWKGSGEEAVSEIYHELAKQLKPVTFVGYEKLEVEGKILALISGGKRVKEVSEGDEVELVADTTPFYAESGGQVGDQGVVSSAKGKLDVADTRRPVEGIITHRGKATGALKEGDKIKLTVSAALRRPTMLNHTATHILHAALREILGTHVKQAGSLVDPDRLRFDFNHFEAVTAEQIEKIEQRVNEVVLANYPVSKEEMALKEAQKKGALAFFGEKYGERVRVVSVGPYSTEFCGGTHLDASGEIGLFKITAESSVASGVRRVEAVTGMKAFLEFQKLEREVDEMATFLKAAPSDLPARVKKMAEKVKELEGEVSRLKSKLASGGFGGGDYMAQVKEIKGVKVLALEVDLDDPKALREFSDQVKNRLGSGIAVIGSKAGGKVALIVTVSADLTSKYNAGKIVSELAVVVGGRGGGRPDMAQAGGPLVEKLSEALQKITAIV